MDKNRLKEVMDQATAALQLSQNFKDRRSVNKEMALVPATQAIVPMSEVPEHTPYNEYVEKLGTLPPPRDGKYPRYRSQPRNYEDRWVGATASTPNYQKMYKRPTLSEIRDPAVYPPPRFDKPSRTKPKSVQPRSRFEPENIKLPRLVPRQDPLPPIRSTEGSPLELTSPRHVVRPLPHSPLSKDLPWVNRTPRDYCPQDLITQKQRSSVGRDRPASREVLSRHMRKIVKETLQEQWPPYGTRLRRNENLSPRTAIKIIEDLEDMKHRLISMDQCMPGLRRRFGQMFCQDCYDPDCEGEMDFDRSPRRCVSMASQPSAPLAICAPPPRRVNSSTANLQPSLPPEPEIRQKKGVSPPEEFQPSPEFEAQLGTIHDNLVALTDPLKEKTPKTLKAERKPGYEDLTFVRPSSSGN